VLNSLLCLDLRADSGSRSSYDNVSLVINWMSSDMNLPAAAAGSIPSFDAATVAGLSEPLGSGLLLRILSDLALGGDRERLSNLEARLGSGSF
jgi:hypothetical protein